jgi:hypothetical protein
MELEAQYKNWIISQSEYTQGMDELLKLSKDWVYVFDELWLMMQKFNQMKLDKSADKNELESLRQQILRTIDAQLKLNSLIWWNVWQIKVWNLLENTIQSNLQKQKQNISNWSLPTTSQPQSSNIKNTNSSNVNINVNANVSWNADINKLANELARKVELANKGIF